MARQAKNYIVGEPTWDELFAHWAPSGGTFPPDRWVAEFINHCQRLSTPSNAIKFHESPLEELRAKPHVDRYGYNRHNYVKFEDINFPNLVRTKHEDLLPKKHSNNPEAEHPTPEWLNGLENTEYRALFDQYEALNTSCKNYRLHHVNKRYSLNHLRNELSNPEAPPHFRNCINQSLIQQACTAGLIKVRTLDELYNDYETLSANYEGEILIFGSPGIAPYIRAGLYGDFKTFWNERILICDEISRYRISSSKSPDGSTKYTSTTIATYAEDPVYNTMLLPLCAIKATSLMYTVLTYKKGIRTHNIQQHFLHMWDCKLDLDQKTMPDKIENNDLLNRLL